MPHEEPNPHLDHQRTDSPGEPPLSIAEDGSDMYGVPGYGALDKLRRHYKLAAGLVPLAALAIKITPLINGEADSVTYGRSQQITRKITADYNGDGRIESNERITQADFNEIPKPQDLPPVLSEPITTKEGKIPDELKQYQPWFVGAYRSIEGEAFNFYAAAQLGEESALNQDFQVNPQAIEYILEQVGSNIQNAPENSSKHRIIDNLREIKDGEKDSVTDILVDVSPTGGCLDPSDQLVKFTQAICETKGASRGLTRYLPSSPGEQLVVLSARSTTIVSKAKSAQKTVRDTPGQQATAEHEMIHVLSGEDSNNTFKEGDPDHEITSWLVDGRHYNQYDFKGATGPSPRLGRKLETLVATGALPPILSVKK